MWPNCKEWKRLLQCADAIMQIFGSTHIAFILPYCYKARALIIGGFSLPLYSSLSYYLVLGMCAQTAMKMSISTRRRREMVWPDVGSWWWVEPRTSLYQHAHSGMFCDDLPGEMRTNVFLPETETQQQTKERMLTKFILMTHAFCWGGL